MHHRSSAWEWGGRQARIGYEYGNNYDHFSAEYEYPNGVLVAYMGAQIDTYASRNHQRVVGSKGSAILDFRHGEITGSNSFEATNDGPSPSVRQYQEMIDSIRNNKAMNEGNQISNSTLTAIIGRMSAYTGQEVPFDWALNQSLLDLSPDKMEFGPGLRQEDAVPGITQLY